MQLGGNKLNIVGSKGQWLVLSDPKTYHQYLCQELSFNSSNICEFYKSLIQQKPDQIMQTIHCKKTIGEGLLVFTKPFDITLKDLLPKAGTFRNEQLLNTLSEILALLEGLNKKNLKFGMLSADTLCFDNGNIKLTFGKSNTIINTQTYLQNDLLALGNLILELATGPNSSKESLQRLKIQYSKKLYDVISTLIDSKPQNRILAFQLIKPEPNKPALIEANSCERSEYTYQHFKNKINRVDNNVKQKLQKIKKMMMNKTRKAFNRQQFQTK